jgi:hypothetical protein
VSNEDIMKVGELLELKKELHFICKSKIKSLNIDHKVAFNNLLGMKFNMDDMKKVVEAEEVKVAKVEKVLIKILEQGLPTIDVVCDLIFILHHLSTLHLLITICKFFGDLPNRIYICKLK